jgi:hypothetical protein
MALTAEPLAELIPTDPSSIHRRLTEIAREQHLLRRQLRLSMAAHRELQRRRELEANESTDNAPQGQAVAP